MNESVSVMLLGMWLTSRCIVIWIDPVNFLSTHPRDVHFLGQSDSFLTTHTNRRNILLRHTNRCNNQHKKPCCQDTIQMLFPPSLTRINSHAHLMLDEPPPQQASHHALTGILWRLPLFCYARVASAHISFTWLCLFSTVLVQFLVLQLSQWLTPFS